MRIINACEPRQPIVGRGVFCLPSFTHVKSTERFFILFSWGGAEGREKNSLTWSLSYSLPEGH